MAGVFFSSPYLKGGKQSAKLANLTKYISTREGVELLKDTDSDLPATKQQQDFITRLLKAFPDTHEMPEYEDYKAECSQKNAAEFISQVQENSGYLLDKRENYVDYVANRPGVKKLGEHGLWNADGKVSVLQMQSMRSLIIKATSGHRSLQYSVQTLSVSAMTPPIVGAHSSAPN